MNIRFNEEDTTILEAMAAHTGLTKSDLVRVAIRRLAIYMESSEWKFKKPIGIETKDRRTNSEQKSKAHS